MTDTTRAFIPLVDNFSRALILLAYNCSRVSTSLAGNCARKYSVCYVIKDKFSLRESSDQSNEKNAKPLTLDFYQTLL